METQIIITEYSHNESFLLTGRYTFCNICDKITLENKYFYGQVWCKDCNIRSRSETLTIEEYSKAKKKDSAKFLKSKFKYIDFIFFTFI